MEASCVDQCGSPPVPAEETSGERHYYVITSTLDGTFDVLEQQRDASAPLLRSHEVLRIEKLS